MVFAIDAKKRINIPNKVNRKNESLLYNEEKAFFFLPPGINLVQYGIPFTRLI
jgi:hypothetical protein